MRIDPEFANPTLAELAWVAARRAARALRAAVRSAGPRRSTSHQAVDPGPRHLSGAVTPSRHLAAAKPSRWASLTAVVGALWRRPAFAAAVAGTVAAAFPLALLVGGNAHTFALWHTSETVVGGWITAGNLDMTSGAWTAWEEVGGPDSGSCLVAPGDSPHPGQCADGSDPLSDFVAMPSGVVKLTGSFTTELEGNNIAAWLKFSWGAWPGGNPDEDAVSATYAVSADPDGSGFVEVTDSTSRPAVGDSFKVATTNDPAYQSGSGVRVVTLPDGIQQPGAVAWQVAVLVEVSSSYNWSTPGSGTGDVFALPALKWELEQIRAGDKFGVLVP
jgi:alternate signal-mediated exported protein